MKHRNSHYILLSPHKLSVNKPGGWLKMAPMVKARGRSWGGGGGGQHRGLRTKALIQGLLRYFFEKEENIVEIDF